MPPQDANPTPSFGGFGLSRSDSNECTLRQTHRSTYETGSSDQPDAKGLGSPAGRVEDNIGNTSPRPEAGGEDARPAEKSPRTEPESRPAGATSGNLGRGSQFPTAPLGARPEAKGRGPSADNGEGHLDKDVQSAETGPVAGPVAKAQEGPPEGGDHGPVADGSKDNPNRDTHAQAPDKGRVAKPAATAHEGPPEGGDHGPPADESKDNPGKGAQTPAPEEERGAQPVAKAQEVPPEEGDQRPPTGNGQGDASKDAQSSDERRGAQHVAKTEEGPPAEKDQRPPGKGKDNAGKDAQSSEKGREAQLVAKALEGPPEVGDLGPPAEESKDNAGKSADSAKNGRRAQLVAKAQYDESDTSGRKATAPSNRRR